MSDGRTIKESAQVRAWLDHTQQLDQDATAGPWETSAEDTQYGGVASVLGPVEPWQEGSSLQFVPVVSTSSTHADAEWIAHARTALPQATAAIRAVLDQHQQADYQRHIPRMLRRTPEDHLPYRPCDGCREEWPCPTVQAITAALTSHQHPTPPGSSGKCNHEARGTTWAEGNTTAYVCETCEHEWTQEGDPHVGS